MEELEHRQAITAPPIKLLLAETNIPEDGFPPGAEVLFPTYARLSVKEGTLTVDLIVRDGDDQDGYGYTPPLPDFDSDRPVLPLILPRQELVRLVIEESWTSYPKAKLYIRDPLGVFSELYLFFKPWSQNHPAYHVQAFAKLVADGLGLPVEYEEKPAEPNLLF